MKQWINQCAAYDEHWAFSRRFEADDDWCTQFSGWGLD